MTTVLSATCDGRPRVLHASPCPSRCALPSRCAHKWEAECQLPWSPPCLGALKMHETNTNEQHICLSIYMSSDRHTDPGTALGTGFPPVSPSFSHHKKRPDRLWWSKCQSTPNSSEHLQQFHNRFLFFLLKGHHENQANILTLVCVQFKRETPYEYSINY